MAQNIKNQKLSKKNSFFTKFFLFCAGANTRHIYKSECERDRSKYASIGATILITAIMAGLSGGYALFTVFQSPVIAATLGSFWGITIFNLDRSFTSTTKKTKENKDAVKQFVATGIRLSLATLVGLVIAKPFEIKVFESKINETIAREALIKNKKTRNSTSEADKIEELKDELIKLQNNAIKKEAKWLEWEKKANGEAEGISGTGRRGKGIVYDDKKETATQLQQQLKDLRNSIDKKEAEITRLEKSQDKTIAKIDEETKITIVDQLATLHKLAKKEDVIFWSSLGISSLLIAIEISPLLVKILAPYGIYDALIEVEEENFIDIQGQKISSAKNSIYTETKISNKIREHTANFIDQQYTKALQESLSHESLNQVREKLISIMAEIVENQLSQRIKDISKSDLETGSMINEIFDKLSIEKYQQELSLNNRKNKINNILNDFKNIIDNSIDKNA